MKIIIYFVFMMFAVNTYATFNELDKKIEEIKHLSTHEQLPLAIEKIKINLKQYPEDVQLHLLYAKFLYWQNMSIEAKKEIEPYKKYDSVLYHKIFLSWATKHLKSLKTAKEKIQFYAKLDLKFQKNYDMTWVVIDTHISLHHFKKALILTEKLEEQYPESQELKERLASLLFWNHYNKKSLDLYNRLTKKYGEIYLKEIAKIKRSFKKPIKKIKNKKKIRRALSKVIPFSYNKNLQKNIMQSVKKRDSMLGIGFANKQYSDKRYKDSTKYIETTLLLSEYTLYLHLEDTKRYGLKDQKIEGEFYPKLPNPHWGYLSFSYTFDADFFSQYSLGWHHYYGWKDWQFGVGYVWSKYKTENITTLSAEYAYYFSDVLFFRQVGFYVPRNESWALLNQFKYQAPNHLEGYIEYINAHSNEVIENSDIFLGNDTQKINIGFEYPLENKYAFGASIGKEWIDGKPRKYNRTQVKCFFRIYW